MVNRLTSSTAFKSVAATAAAWLLCAMDWMWWQRAPVWASGIVFAAVAIFSAWHILKASKNRRENPVHFVAVLSIAFFPLWTFAVFALDCLELAGPRVWCARMGTATAYFGGLAWVIWLIEKAAREFDLKRFEKRHKADGDSILAAVLHGKELDHSPVERTANPLDPEAWYYGKKSKRLNQSLAAFMSYSLVFFIAFLIITQMGGCQELYEMPAGGGEQQQIAQQVKVQKIIRKKFVVNPFAAISFKVPPIDEIKLQLNEITKHAYTVGYGQGAGAGFAGGTKLGKVRFIRLEYQGGDWDQDFGIGADVNMLIEYGIRTQQKVEKVTESRTVGELNNFPIGKSPPFVYMTGQRSIQLSKSEIKTLREFILDKHGMLFADNGGSRGWHSQFLAVMNQVLPNVRPTPIPLDDQIHRIPYQIPFLPYVAPHGGKEALGWRVDGRLVCYYHPGDIGDAWTDDHSGVSPEIWEACYQLGTNVIFYAHTEYAKWLAARQQTD